MARSLRSDRGAILIAVLGMTALAAAIAMEIAYSSRIEGERVLAMKERAHALLFAEAGYKIALEALAQSDAFIVPPSDPQSKPLTWSKPEGEARAMIVDESALFPLHLLLDAKGLLHIGWKTRLERLFNIEEIPIPLIDALIDYADPDDAPFPRGAEAPAYRSMQPPRKPPNRMLKSLGELELVHGFDTEAAAAIAKLSRLHGDALVNINHAPPAVLASLSTKINRDDARRIAARARTTPYKTLSEIRDAIDIDDAALNELSAVATVAPNLFRIISEGRSGSSEVVIVTIVARQDDRFTVKWRRME